MSHAQSKQLVHRPVEIVNDGDLDSIDEVEEGKLAAAIAVPKDNLTRLRQLGARRLSCRGRVLKRRHLSVGLVFGWSSGRCLVPLEAHPRAPVAVPYLESIDERSDDRHAASLRCI
jgi:hypothetical protein